MKKLLALSIFLAIVIPCSAATITVNWDGSGDYTTIQAAINAAVSGADTIIVAEGTYDENINFGGKNLILTSTNPNNPVVVYGTVIEESSCHGPVVKFTGTENNTCLLTGFTITGGCGGFGGGIEGNGTEASIIKCVLTGNIGFVGGGACQCFGIVKDCVITGNEAQYGGGLAECDGTISDISNCLIMNNYSEIDGGGLYDCSAEITNCLITHNVAEWAGAAGDIHVPVL